MPKSNTNYADLYTDSVLKSLNSSFSFKKYSSEILATYDRERYAAVGSTYRYKQAVSLTIAANKCQRARSRLMSSMIHFSQKSQNIFKTAL